MGAKQTEHTYHIDIVSGERVIECHDFESVKEMERFYKRNHGRVTIDGERISHEEAYRRFGGTANEKLNGGWK